jgi:hypothetical protein
MNIYFYLTQVKTSMCLIKHHVTMAGRIARVNFDIFLSLMVHYDEKTASACGHFNFKNPCYP